MKNINQKLPNGQFLYIEALYVFIAKDKDGHEGVMAFIHDGDWMPMIGADLDRVDALKGIAESIAKKMKLEYEVRYFRVAGDIAPSLYKSKDP